ncbi:MAG: hypothetical protein ACYS7Y_15940 [Planctomycetota bacterium]|jgi:hypothetical protein
MPHWKCTKCHHEWDGSRDKSMCDWCEAPGRVLEENTPLELMIRDMNKGGLKNLIRATIRDED